jgi:hypothetical protein
MSVEARLCRIADENNLSDDALVEKLTQAYINNDMVYEVISDSFDSLFSPDYVEYNKLLSQLGYRMLSTESDEDVKLVMDDTLKKDPDFRKENYPDCTDEEFWEKFEQDTVDDMCEVGVLEQLSTGEVKWLWANCYGTDRVFESVEDLYYDEETLRKTVKFMLENHRDEFLAGLLGV